MSSLRYASGISATGGDLSSHVKAWDTFTDVDDTVVESHVASDGGSWTLHPSSGAGSSIIGSNRVRNPNSATSHWYLHSWTPPSADYISEIGMVLLTDNDASVVAAMARMDPSALTFYMHRYDTQSGAFQLFKAVAGTGTQLGGNISISPAVGQLYRVGISVRGTTITALLDGTPIITVTDSAISAAGKAGFRTQNAATATTGLHIDEWRVFQ